MLVWTGSNINSFSFGSDAKNNNNSFLDTTNTTHAHAVYFHDFIIYLSILNDEFLHHLSKCQTGCDIYVRSSFRSTSPYQSCRRVLITKFDFLGLGTTFSMYNRVHIKRVPIRLLCRLDIASSQLRGTKQAQWEHGLNVMIDMVRRVIFVTVLLG